jgi:hypothetical protein
MDPQRLPPPRLSRVLRRTRLERALADAALSGGIYLQGIAGSGKTTLVASWLRAERRPALWYRVSPTDEDPARFFESLGAAVAPALEPYTPGAPAPRFFAELFSRLRRRTALVFEDFHQVAPDGAVARAAAIALDQASRDHPVVLVSRAPPPPSVARALALRGAPPLPSRELLLTHDELDRLMQLRPEWRRSGHSASELMSRTRGWLAAVILALSARDRVGRETAGYPESELFALLAEDVLDELDAETRSALGGVAFLPDFTLDEAARQAGAGAASAVSELFRHGALIEQIGAHRMRFHPLLQAFLRERVPPARARELRQRAALHLREVGRVEDAVALLIESASEPERASVVLDCADALWGGGRWVTLGKLLSGLAVRAGEDPWLDFWRARLALTSDFASAARGFERASRAFVERHDARGVARCIIGRIQAVLYEGASFAALAPVLDELDELDEAYASLPPEIQAELAAFVLIAIWNSGALRAHLPRWASRAHAVLASEASPTARVLVGCALVTHLTFEGAVAEAEAVRRLTAILADEEPGLAASVAFDLASARLDLLSGEARAAANSVERGLSRLERSGLNFWRDSLVSTGLTIALTLGDLARAEQHLVAINQLAARGRTIDVGNALYGATLIAVHRGDWPAADALAFRTSEHADALGFPAAQTLSRALLATCRRHTGRADEARDLMRRARSVEGVPRAWPGLLSLMEAAWDDPPRLELLQSGFGTLREAGTSGFVALLRPVDLALLCAAALRQGVEAEHVRAVIRKYDLVPPDPSVEGWPWRLEIRVLGGLRIDPTPAWGRKRPRVPLALLELLAQLGRPRDRRVSPEKLIDALWPDAEGDAGQHSLEVAIHRLRRLLGDSSTVLVDREGVGLDPARTWVDVWQLERLVGEAPCQERQRLIAALYVGPPPIPLAPALERAMARALVGASPEVWAAIATGDRGLRGRLESVSHR